MGQVEFEVVEQDYFAIKKLFQEEDHYNVAKDIAKQIGEYEQIFEGVFAFLIDAFEGQKRKDGKTPLVFHSIYLTKLLASQENNLDTLLVAALHDVLEDTNISEEALKTQPFMQGKEHLIDWLKILTEDTNLSRDSDGKNLPPRYVEHIGRIIGAPKEVVNVEVVDRFSDLMDLEYILKLPEAERNLRLASKIIKVRSFVENITRDREDINLQGLSLFNYKADQVQEKYSISAEAGVIYGSRGKDNPATT